MLNAPGRNQLLNRRPGIRKNVWKRGAGVGVTAEVRRRAVLVSFAARLERTKQGDDMKSARILGMILAGGQGSRLSPLTLKRSKPAVPFGSKYRIIDFAINNFMNSDIFSIYVLTQFKAQSLTEHIQRGWRFGTFLSDYFITLVPAQMYRFEELGPVRV